MSLNLAGKTYFVPGIYSITRVINLSGVALAPFNIGVIIGSQQKGKPYTVGTGSTPITADQFIPGYSDITAHIADYGNEGDNEIATFFRYAKKAGAGMIFTLGVAPTTACKDGEVSNVTPVVAIKITSRGYGAWANDTSLTIVASVHTIIPPKNTTFLTANSGTGSTVFVNNVTPYRVGDTVLLTDNVYAAPVSKVIQSINTVAKTITFTTVISASALIANYARIFQEDVDAQEISVALDTPDKVLDFYGKSKVLSAVIATGITIMPVTLAKTYVQNLTGATKATSPAALAADWQNVADNFQRWNEEFALVNKFYLRVIGLASSDAANHAAFRDMATRSEEHTS